MVKALILPVLTVAIVFLWIGSEAAAALGIVLFLAIFVNFLANSGSLSGLILTLFTFGSMGLGLVAGPIFLLWRYGWIVAVACLVGFVVWGSLRPSRLD